MRTNILASAVALSDRDLLAGIDALVGRERDATADLVAHLAALEMRPNLYVAQGYCSLFAYCTEALHLSEDAACNRIDAARASTRFPVILDFLAAGSVTLTAVRMLKRHLTPENHEAVLARASHRTKEEIEVLIAELAPKPDVAASVRKLPVPKTPATMPEMSALVPTLLDASPGASTPLTLRLDDSPAGPPAAAAGDPRDAGLREPQVPPPPAALRIARPIVQALAPQRYRVQFTIGQDTHDRLRRVQALLRRQIPSGDPAAIFDRALRVLEEVEKKRLGFAARPGRRGCEAGRDYESRIRSGTDKTHKDVRGPGGSAHALTRAVIDPALQRRVGPSRHVPNEIKRAVWRRDAGQCAFVSDAGHRCTQRSFLDLHHIQPYAMDGPATVGNISLRCRRHNQYEGELVFGPGASSMARKPDEIAT